ncbi:hypothetical protein PTMSG1_09379 [Pyrenophora teres f. maculata]|nr:hypothetical protein PTMSG1_09379 [Pyrenophora teres f. maculata]
MSDSTRRKIDMSLFGFEHKSDSDAQHLDVVTLHQPVPQQYHTHIVYSQDAAHDLIDDYIASEDTLLVQEGERMRAAEEGRTVTEEPSGAFGGRKRAASNDAIGSNDRARRPPRDSYSQVADDASTGYNQTRHGNSPINLSAARKEASSAVINVVNGNININTETAPQSINHYPDRARCQGHGYGNPGVYGRYPRSASPQSDFHSTHDEVYQNSDPMDGYLGDEDLDDGDLEDAGYYSDS